MKTRPLLLFFLLLVIPALSSAQSTCRHRGDLDAAYCDENRDFVADSPKNAADHKNPETLTFTFTPIEDPTVYEKIFRPFTDYLGRCTGKKVVYLLVNSDAAEVEAMRTGQLHVASFSTGTTVTAVNKAGAVPFAAKGHMDKTTKQLKTQGYNLVFLVKKNSPYKKLPDLKGKKVAHVSETSNSGHIAPIALLPKHGLTPGKDYNIVFSGKHDNSILGVNSGEYDGAPVAGDVFLRMAARGQINEDDFRILYSSPRFPSSSVAYAHNLEPVLRDLIVKCVMQFELPPEMQKPFGDSNRFVPITYQADWSAVRVVNTASESIKKVQADKGAAPAKK